MESLRNRIPSMKPNFERIRPASSVSSVFSLSTMSTMSTMSSQRDSYEGSLRLNRESARLMYEDIAKLNPFYEVYENFWNADSEESSLTFSSRGSSDSARSPSLASITSSQDSFRPLEISSSPSIRHFRSHLDLDETKKIQVFLHEGSEHQPTYAEYDGQRSQFAALDYADNDKRPLSPIEEPEDDSDSDELEPDLRPKVHPSKYPHKKLFGQDGWLGCSTDVHALPLEKRTSMVFKGIGNKIKKQVGEIADDMAKAYPNRFSSAALRRSKSSLNLAARVSLDPATQSKLYSDLEVMICLSANDFLVQQHGEGRLSAESIKKINSFWGSKNRPQVVEFHFDQATQRRLINDNLRTLQFNGECSTNPIRLVTNMNNWKALANDMSVRTFCVPDSVIRKHLHDIHEILDMLDAPRETFLDFEELQVRTLSLMKDQSYRSGSDNSTLSGSRTSKTSSSIRCSEDSRRMYRTKC